MPTAPAGRTPTEAAAVPLPARERLDANLRAIGAIRPDLAVRIAESPADPALAFSVAPDGALTATRDGRALASKRRPREEASRVADSIDVREHAVFVVMGFGLGHHVRAIAERLGRTGLICVFEPDLALLRAVLERVDCTAWLGSGNVIIFDDAEDTAAISRAAHQREAIFGLGVRFVEHGPSAVRLGASAGTFSHTVAQAVAAVRTSVVTTMVQTEVTVRNGLMNAEHYVAGAGRGDEGICDLEGLCAGRPAIVVSAGPSLRRNIHLLRDPAVREKCVIIAVQTALKTLLAEGIKPHFVCALDYHEISKRFYDGLTAEDVAGVTLVAEGKVNAAVLDAYPGPVRMAADETLDLLLPPALRGEHGRIRAGSTVAHLCYYLARHLGCDPVILTGQDLAFTDGVYYGEGAAIHQVWAAELGPFRTLEMMEWERIARSKRSLRAVRDRDGERLYTDEQMATYRVQLERTFAEDAERGFTTLDASEGGAVKANADPVSLREALDAHAGADAPDLPAIPVPPRAALAPDRRAALSRRFAEVRQQVGRVELLCERSAKILERMHGLDGDQSRLNPLIEELHAMRDETRSLQPGYELVQKINQTGAFNRARADRDIHLADDTPLERQRRQIERDQTNVRWLGEAAGETARLLDAAQRALEGAEKITRSSCNDHPETVALQTDRTACVICVDHEQNHDGRARTLDGQTLRDVLGRVASCRTIERVVLASGDVARTRAMTVDAPATLRIEHSEIDLCALRDARRTVSAARVWSPDAWRGGLGGATVYDGLYDASTLARLMNEHGLDTALLVGDDWTALDPGVTDEIVRRRGEDPENHRVVFSQAAPGRAGIALARGLVEEFASAKGAAQAWSSVGSVLGYMPFHPLADPISKPLCVTIDPALRDAPSDSATGVPSHLIVELSATRPNTGGLRAVWCNETEHAMLSAREWTAILERSAQAFPDACVSFAGRGDPLAHPDALEILAHARTAGFRFVHVRTDPCNDHATLAQLREHADVISLDLLANTAETYETLTGRDDFERAVEGVDRLITDREGVLPWIVPRLTRCAPAMGDIEGFYDRWLLRCRAAVIDPLPNDDGDGRIAPLTTPAIARDRAIGRTLFLDVGGHASTGWRDRVPGERVVDARNGDLHDVWASVRGARGER